MTEEGVLSMRVTNVMLSGWGQADVLQINSITTDVSAFLYSGVSVGPVYSVKYIGELIERLWWPTSCFLYMRANMSEPCARSLKSDASQVD